MDTTFYLTLRQAIDTLELEDETADEISEDVNAKYGNADTVELVQQIQGDLFNEYELRGEDAWKAYLIGVKTTLNMFEIRHQDKLNNLLGGLPGNVFKKGGGLF